MVNVYMTGNTHFDPVWLWRWDEAMASIRATFRSVLERMEEDPDFYYAFSAPAVFEWIERVDPALFEKIRARIEEGRWELGEAWWLQADSYTALGESYVRQGLYGQRWLKSRFGKTSRTCYSIDSFGHPDTLPGILAGCGVDNMMFVRPNEKQKPLPAPLFRWEGQDGTRMPAYRVGGEGCEAYADKFADAYEKLFSNIPAHDCDRLVVFGVTDHGGAPTKACLREIHRAIREEKRCRVRFSTVEEFFDDQREKDLPLVQGELEVPFIGPSVNGAEVKQNCRRTEVLALHAETAALLARRLIDRPLPKKDLAQAWKDILFNEFHDILGACCIPSADIDARDRHGRAAQTASEVLNNSVQAIAKEIRMPGKNPDNAWNLVVFNLSGVGGEREIEASAQWAWEFPWYRGGIELVSDAGEVIPAQVLWSDAVIPGFRTRFVFRCELPTWGWRTFIIRQTGKAVHPIANKAQDARVIENDRLCVTLSEKGGIAEVYSKEEGRTLARNLLTPFVQKDICDTWGFNKTVYEEEREELTFVSARVTEDGEERTTVRQTLRYGTSTVEETVSVWHKTGRIDARVRAIWSEEGCALRLRYAFDGFHTVNAGLPAGHVSREKNELEKPMNRRLSLIGDKGGVTLTTDSIFAYNYNGEDVALTVLRNCLYGDLRTEALAEDGDFPYMGQGETNVSLKLHFFREFSATEAERDAIRDWQEPQTILEANHEGTLPPDFTAATLSDTLVPMALKATEDGDGVTLRLRNAEDGTMAGAFTYFDSAANVSAEKRRVETFVLEDGKLQKTNHLEER